MTARTRRGLLVRWLTVALTIGGAAAIIEETTPQAHQAAGVKLAFYNIRSGKGIPGLRGRPTPFADVNNCADTSKPLNAWGAGIVQRTIREATADDEVIALGLAESWKAVCASPENVRAALGWKAVSSSHNGVALVARYGLRDEVWQQLDTTQNSNPADTAWVLHAQVFADRAGRRTLPVFVAHWYGTGAGQTATYERQARQTLAFMRSKSAGKPHVLMGDLNVWTAASGTCRQTPNGDAALQALRSAGYVDAWPTTQGAADGSTGMLNRASCGTPEGTAWKRIDYAWSPAAYPPLGMQRFGMVPPGEAAPSDHYGIITRYGSP